MVRIFISHASCDRSTASAIKLYLGSCGQEAFVAHDDIQVAIPWKEEIKRYLRECDAMVVLVTQASMESYWVHQEIGSAMIRGIPIIPIKNGTDPLGFLGDYQAAPLKKKFGGSLDYDDCTKKIVYTLLRDESCSRGVREDLIKRVRNCKSYDGAALLFTIIADVPTTDYWAPGEVEEMLKDGLSNDQVSHSGRARRPIWRLINNNRESLSPELIQQWERFCG